MSKEFEYLFLQRRYTNGQWVPEKCIVRHQRNAKTPKPKPKQNSEMPRNTRWVAVIQGRTLASVGEDAEKWDLQRVAGGTVNGATDLGKDSAVFKQLNVELPRDPAIVLLNTHSGKIRTCLCKGRTWMFIAALLNSQTENNLNIYHI